MLLRKFKKLSEVKILFLFLHINFSSSYPMFLKFHFRFHPLFFIFSILFFVLILSIFIFITGMVVKKYFKFLIVMNNAANKIKYCYYHFLAMKQRKIMVDRKILKIFDSIFDNAFVILKNKWEKRIVSATKIQKIIRGRKGKKLFARIRVMRREEYELELKKLKILKEKQEREAKILKNKKIKALRTIKFIVIGHLTRKKYIPLIRARTQKRLKAALLINKIIGSLYHGRKARKRAKKLKEIKRKKDELILRARKLQALRVRSGDEMI